MEDAIGAKAALTLDPGDATPPFFFAGIFATVELLYELDGQTLIRVVLRPRFSLLGPSWHSRNFEGCTLFRARLHRTHEEGTRFTDRSAALGDDEELVAAPAGRVSVSGREGIDLLTPGEAVIAARAEYLEYEASAAFHVKAEATLVNSPGLTKIDGSQIHLG